MLFCSNRNTIHPYFFVWLLINWKSLQGFTLKINFSISFSRENILPFRWKDWKKKKITSLFGFKFSRNNPSTVAQHLRASRASCHTSDKHSEMKEFSKKADIISWQWIATLWTLRNCGVPLLIMHAHKRNIKLDFSLTVAFVLSFSCTYL